MTLKHELRVTGERPGRDPIPLRMVRWLGVNAVDGWAFGVGVGGGDAGGRWCGFAADNSRVTVFLRLTTDGVMGVDDEIECCRRSVAVITDGQSGFGGFTTEYFLPDAYGSAADYRCDECGKVLCVEHDATSYPSRAAS